MHATYDIGDCITLVMTPYKTVLHSYQEGGRGTIVLSLNSAWQLFHHLSSHLGKAQCPCIDLQAARSARDDYSKEAERWHQRALSLDVDLQSARCSREEWKKRALDAEVRLKYATPSEQEAEIRGWRRRAMEAEDQWVGAQKRLEVAQCLADEAEQNAAGWREKYDQLNKGCSDTRKEQKP